MATLQGVVPDMLLREICKSRFYAPKSEDLVIQSDDSRRQAENTSHCFQKLYDLIIETGNDLVPGETSAEQSAKVKKL